MPSASRQLLEGLNEPQREAVDARRGAAADPRRGGQRQDPRARPPDRLPDLHRPGARPARSSRSRSPTRPPGRCASASRRCSGRGTRGMWLMTFHAACARILRSRGRPPRLHAPVHDLRPGRLAAAGQALRGRRRRRPQALHARRHPQPDLRRPRTSCSTPRPTARPWARQFEEMVADVYDDLRARHAPHERDGLRRPAVPHRQPARAVRGRAHALRHRLPARARRRVPGHQPRAVPPAPAARGGGGPRRAAPRSSATATSRSSATTPSRSTASAAPTCATSWTSRTTSRTPRVVKLEQNYRSTETILSAANAVIANNRGGIAKALWSDLGQGEQIQLRALDDEHAEARYIVGEIERQVDEGASRVGDRGALPHERDVAGDRGRARAQRDRLPGDRRHEVLRARRDQGRDRLPVRCSPTRSTSSASRASPTRRGAASGRHSLARVIAPRRARWGSRSGTSRPCPRRSPGLGAAAIKALGRFMATMGLRELAASAAGRATEPRAAAAAPVAELIEALLVAERLRARRWRPSARSRRRGALRTSSSWSRSAASSTRRPPTARTRSTCSCSRSRSSPTPTRARDDEGLVTLMTLHNAKGLEYPIVFIAGCEDGVFPHSRAHRRRRRSRRSGACSTSAITRAMRRLHLTYARRRAVFGAPDLRHAQPLPGRDSRGPARGTPGAGARAASLSGRARSRAPRPRCRAARRGGGVGQSAAARRSRPPPSSGSARTSSTPRFGDGVVTGVEPGGVIVVRFAGDGSERKLMAEYAPLSRR